MDVNYKSVFDILDLEDGDAADLLARAQILKDSFRARYSRLHFCRQKYSEYNAEYHGICQACEKKRDFLRFILDCEELICYDCFYESMQISGEFYSYHGRTAEEMEGFMYDDEWEYLWAKENPHMILNEEDGEYYEKAEVKRVIEEVPGIMELFKVFDKQLGI